MGMKSTSNEVVGGRVAEMCEGVGMRLPTPRQVDDRVLCSESPDESERPASEPERSLPCMVEPVPYEMRLEVREGDAAESRDWSCER